MLSEINEKLEAEIAVAGNSARTSKEDSDYRTWYEDELAAENEILRGQNEALRNAANTTSKKEEALLNPTVEEFFGGLEGDEDFTIREDVQGDSKRTVLTAKTKSDRSK